jgi:hypothetical protein
VLLFYLLLCFDVVDPLVENNHHRSDQEHGGYQDQQQPKKIFLQHVDSEKFSARKINLSNTGFLFLKPTID